MRVVFQVLAGAWVVVATAFLAALLRLTIRDRRRARGGRVAGVGMGPGPAPRPATRTQANLLDEATRLADGDLGAPAAQEKGA